MSEANENEQLRAQLRALEQRVARLEAEREASRSGPVPEAGARSAADLAASLSRARSTGAVPVPTPVPLPVSPPPIPAAIDPSAGGPRDAEAGAAQPGADGKPDLERFFALTVLGRVGIAAIVLAAAYFGQLGWSDLPAGMRAALVYVFGVGLVLAGVLLRPRVDARYVALLWGGGVAVSYLAGVLAHLRYAVVSSTFAMVSLLATAAIGQLLAHRLRLELLATVALAGAYAAPVLVGTPSGTPTSFFVLLLVLHAWAAWTEHRWHWHVARLLAVVATVGLVCTWFVTNESVGVTVFATHVALVWFLLALPELLRALTARRDPAREPSLGRIVAVCLAGLVAAACASFVNGMPRWVGLLVSVGFLAAGAGFRLVCIQMGEWLARVPSVLALLAVIAWLRPSPSFAVGQSTDFTVLLGFAVVGGWQLLARRWTGVGELGASVAAGASVWLVSRLPSSETDLSLLQAPLLLVLPVALLCFARPLLGQVAGLLLGEVACVVGALQARSELLDSPHRVSLALVGATVVASFASLLAGRRRSRELGCLATALHVLLMVAWLTHCLVQRAPGSEVDPTPFANLRFASLAALLVLLVFSRVRLPREELMQRAVLAVVVLAASYVGVLLELLDIVRDWGFGPHAAATSIYTLVFAILLLVVGSLRRVQALRWAALVAFAGVALKVAFYDLSESETPVRVLVSGVLGAVLLAVAWGYARGHRADRGG